MIEIPKKKINLELGDKILDYILKDNQIQMARNSENTSHTSNKDNINNFLKNNTNTNTTSKLPKKKVSSSSSLLSSGNNTHIFSTKTVPLNVISGNNSGISHDSQFTQLTSSDKNKLPCLKLSYKEYFSSAKCDLCDLTGITNDELKKLQKESQTDCMIYDYILYQCIFCKVYIHKNCANEASSSSLQANSTWVCERCKTKPQLEEPPLCQICQKKDSQLKKPHYYKMIEKSFWVHNFCIMLFKNVFDIEER